MPASPSRALTETQSFAEAEAVLVSMTGISELRYETDKASVRRRGQDHTVTPADLATIDEHAGQAARLGVDYISSRRLAELVGATTLDAYAALNELIAQHRPAQHATSLYAVSLRRSAIAGHAGATRGTDELTASKIEASHGSVARTHDGFVCES
jgi:hypothetical protein